MVTRRGAARASGLGEATAMSEIDPSQPERAPQSQYRRQNPVHPIQHAAVARNQVARVLGPESPFQARFKKVTQEPKGTYDQ